MTEPWKFARDLQNKYWEPKEVEIKLNKIECEDNDDYYQFKMLAVTSLITGRRISELTYFLSEEDRQVIKNSNPRLDFDKIKLLPSYRPALRACDVWITTDEQDRMFLVFSLRTLKQDRKTSKKPIKQKWTERHAVYVPIREGYYLQPFTNIFLEGLKNGGWDKTENGFVSTDNVEKNTSKIELFDLNITRVSELSNRLLECNFHYLRHLHFYWRSTIDKYSVQMIQREGNWKTGDMPLHYSASTEEDIKNALWRVTNNANKL